jgi:hypothetical protein
LRPEATHDDADSVVALTAHAGVHGVAEHQCLLRAREVEAELLEVGVVDPAVHQVVLENDHVRVIDARATHGWKSAMHSHRPMLVINLGSGRQRVASPDGKTQIVDLKPDMVVWRDDAFDHAWELLAGEVRVLLVEVKSANAAAKPSP